MTVETVDLPDLGEGVAEGELLRWLVEVGETVAEDDVIAEMETDKAIVDLPSPVAGRVEERHAAAGEMIPVGDPLVSIDVDADEEGDAESEDEEQMAAERTDDEDAERTPAEPTDRVFAPPRVRRLARELGVDLARVSGSGPNGRITDADVRAASEDTRPTPRSLAAGTTSVLGEVTLRRAHRDPIPDRPTPGDRVAYDDGRRPFDHADAPRVTHTDRVDVTALVELTTELDPYAADAGVDLTPLPFVMRAVVHALAEFPSLNASLDTDEVVYHDDYNLGVATATGAGLAVPVVGDVDDMDLLALASETATLVQRARDRTLPDARTRGGTFTLTNPGAVGGEYATPSLVAPQVATLALGRLAERPQVVDGEVVPRHTLPLSLSVDPRIVDSATAARFTNLVRDRLSTPSDLLVPPSDEGLR
ncbi:dihydrolipoamide acetyltransferase family protein [Haloplanus sp. C73]|uniref:dihydrolipoamide acetyltransferase family protein n=1 Tax=Haloplanus sp. C73 TaxID=3421641 RepID=UPI003EB738D5